jgi:hypothetical protein
MSKSKRKLIATIKLPLYVHTTKSKTTKGKAIFNLNNYRNWFSIKNNKAKQMFKAFVKKQAMPLSLGTGPFLLEYTYFHGNRRKVDVANPCSILDKFACDALTEIGYWPDDNIDYVKEVRYRWGGIDPLKDGYCILKIYNI